MQKVSECPPPLKQPDCSFCSSPSQEARLLLRSSLHRLRRMLQQKKYSEMPNNDEPSTDTVPSIHRLIRVLFQKQQFEIAFSKGCPHTRLRSLFREHLKCRWDQLSAAIQDLCDKLARRNYELEIIACQVKNVENSVIDLEDSETGMSKMRKESRSSNSEDARPSTEEVSVKLEEPDHKPIEISPPTAANYNITFETMPLTYNILFYGQPFFQ